MGNVGGQLGNTNAKQSNRLFNKALKRSVKQGKGDANRLRKITDRLCTEAESGNIQAISIVADRLDGKPNQAITGPNNTPITLVQRVIVQQVTDNNEVIEGEVIQEALPDNEDSE